MLSSSSKVAIDAKQQQHNMVAPPPSSHRVHPAVHPCRAADRPEGTADVTAAGSPLEDDTQQPVEPHIQQAPPPPPPSAAAAVHDASQPPPTQSSGVEAAAAQEQQPSQQQPAAEAQQEAKSQGSSDGDADEDDDEVRRYGAKVGGKCASRGRDSSIVLMLQLMSAGCWAADGCFLAL